MEWWKGLSDVELTPPQAADSGGGDWWKTLPVDVVNAAKGAVTPKQELVMTGAEFEPEEYNPAEAALIGMGRTFSKMGSGIEDMYYRATGDDESRKQLRQSEASDDRQYAKLEGTNPIATTVGEIAPYFLMPGGASAPGAFMSMGTLRGLAGSAAAGGALGASHYNEDALSGALGGAAGAGLGRGAGDLWRYWRGTGLGGPGKHAKEFYELGDKFRLTPGERTGWEWMRRGELARETHALSGMASKSIKDQRQAAINKLAAETIGMPNQSSLTDEVIDAGAQKISEQFNKFGSLPDRIDLHGDFLRKMVSIEDGIGESITTGGENAKRVMSNLLDKMVSGGGKISMADYQRYSSEIMQEANKAFKGANKDPLTGFAMNKLKDALDSTVERQLADPAAINSFRQARNQWRNLATIQKSRITQGNIAPPSVLRAIKGGSGRARTSGKDFTDPMHIVGRFGRDYAPQTGSIVYGGGALRLPKAMADYVIGKTQTGVLGGRSPISASVGGRIAPGLGTVIGSDREGVNPAPEEEPGLEERIRELIGPYIN